MTQKYVLTDDQGRAAAFFDDEIHAGQIPEAAEPISEALWRAWVRDTAGQVFTDGALRKVTPEELMDLGALKARRLQQVNLRREKAFEDGFMWQGHVYDIDLTSRIHMTAAYALLKGGMSNPHGGSWRTRGNRMVAMDDAALAAFLEAAAQYVLSIQQAAWMHKDVLTGMASRGELQSYDVDATWPGSP